MLAFQLMAKIHRPVFILGKRKESGCSAPTMAGRFVLVWERAGDAKLFCDVLA